MSNRPGFGPFLALTEADAPELLQRMSAVELGLDSRRYGITSRLIAKSHVSVAQLGAAVLQKLAATGVLDPARLRAVVLSSRVYDVDEVARDLVERAGLTCQAIGIERACSGFPAATCLAMRLCRERSGPVALVTAEIISTNINWELPDGTSEDHRRARGQAAKLFGDGAAAVVVDNSPGCDPIIDAWQGEVPDDHQLLQKTEIADSLDPFGNVRPGVTSCMTMPGRRGLLLVKRAPQIMADAIARSLASAASAGFGDGVKLDHVVPHQANGLMTARLREALRERFAVPPKVWDCIEQSGNVVSASIPLAMARVQAQLRAGKWIAMPSVGAGGPGYRPDVLSTGCVLIRRGAS